MLISTPFLKSGTTENNSDSIQLAFTGQLGWDCYGDDTKVADQRCDSPKLKALLTSQDEGGIAPSDSAGVYAVWNNLLKHADAAHTLLSSMCAAGTKMPTQEMKRAAALSLKW